LDRLGQFGAVEAHLRHWGVDSHPKTKRLTLNHGGSPFEATEALETFPVLSTSPRKMKQYNSIFLWVIRRAKKRNEKQRFLFEQENKANNNTVHKRTIVPE
jgi:hypothetical protein